jgi:hypothetical protein
VRGVRSRLPKIAAQKSKTGVNMIA